jgi:hypothetical protein
MAVIDSIKNSLIQVGSDIKGIGGKIGDLAALSTTAKNSLVSAINELKATIANLPSSPAPKNSIFVNAATSQLGGVEHVIATVNLDKGGAANVVWDYSFFGDFQNSVAGAEQYRLRLRIGGLAGTLLFDTNNQSIATGSPAKFRKFCLRGKLVSIGNTLRCDGRAEFGAELVATTPIGSSAASAFFIWPIQMILDLSAATTLVLTAQVAPSNANAYVSLYGGVVTPG